MMNAQGGEALQPSILCVDDEQSQLDVIRRNFDEKFRLHFAASGPAALELLEQHPDIGVIISDQRMAPMTGIELLAECAARWPLVTRVLHTAFSDSELLLDAIHHQVHDYVVKSGQMNELETRLRAALRRHELVLADAAPARERDARRADLELRRKVQCSRQGSSAGVEMIGLEGCLRSIDDDIRKVAPTAMGVLIRGETGTGKELVARQIHSRSARANRPFIPVNCAAIPRDLIASELFGNEEGAHNQADKARPGRFELASGGTIFLDEIGDMPLEAQAALLRVLDDGEVTRLGPSARPRKIDIRVIAATHQPLGEMVECNAFRRDLHQRLRRFEICLPALRDRAGDIDALISHFVEQANDTHHKHVTVGGEARRALCDHDWPGNVRELKHTIEAAVVRADDDTVLEPGDFRLERGRPRQPATEPPLIDVIRQEEIDKIRGALRQTRWNISAAARLLGWKRMTLHDKIRRYGIQ